VTSPNGAGSTGERVLVVDDEADIVALVAYHLVKAGYRVSTASTGPDALVAARQERPALIVLDLMLPGASGYDVLDQLRANAATRDIAVLMLTARREEQDRIRGLTLGADDYLTKPFGNAELMARIRVALRHAARSPQDPTSSVITIGDLKIDLMKRLVFVGDTEVHLTPIEYKLLATLMHHAGRVMTHKQLLDQVWGPGHAHQMQYLRVYMTQLRQKLEKTPARPRYLLTEPGVGYRLTAATA